MTLSGWLIMLVSVGSVSTLLAWCVYRVLCVPAKKEPSECCKRSDCQ